MACARDAKAEDRADADISVSIDAKAWAMHEAQVVAHLRAESNEEDEKAQGLKNSPMCITASNFLALLDWYKT